MKDWRAECAQLRKENKNLREANASLEYRAREAERQLEYEQSGRRKELKEAILDLLR